MVVLFCNWGHERVRRDLNAGGRKTFSLAETESRTRILQINPVNIINDACAMLGGFINSGSVSNSQNDYEIIELTPSDGIFVDLSDGNRDINYLKEWRTSRKQHIAKNGICGGNRLGLVGYTPLFYDHARPGRIQNVCSELDSNSECGAFANIGSFHQQREAHLRFIGVKRADQLEINGDPRPFSETELSSRLLSGFLHLSQLFFHQASLYLNRFQGANGYNNADNPDESQGPA